MLKRWLIFIACAALSVFFVLFVFLGIARSGSSASQKQSDSAAEQEGGSGNGVERKKSTEAAGVRQEDKSAEEEMNMKIRVEVEGHIFAAILENNKGAEAFAEMLRKAPIEIQMSDYGGFEKVGPLGAGLPAEDRQMTTQAGDIVLYNGNRIVMFYGSNSWSYTKLGTVDDLSGWEEALGSRDVTVTFSAGE